MTWRDWRFIESQWTKMDHNLPTYIIESKSPQNWPKSTKWTKIDPTSHRISIPSPEPFFGPILLRTCPSANFKMCVFIIFSNEMYKCALQPLHALGSFFRSQKCCFFDPQIDKHGSRNVIQNEHIFRLTFYALFGPIWDRIKMGRKNVHEPTLGSLGCILASTWRAPSGTIPS